MRIIDTPFEGLFIVQPTIFDDNRGSFSEVYNEREFAAKGIHVSFVQDNQSVSRKGVVRGLHFQKPPHAQAKLVRVVQGTALDVAVDLRKESQTYGQHYALILSADNNLQLFIPEGFAHGFAALEEDTVLNYKCSNFYNKSAEGTILFKDPQLKINWFVEEPIVSAKDMEGEEFQNFISPF